MNERETMLEGGRRGWGVGEEEQAEEGPAVLRGRNLLEALLA